MREKTRRHFRVGYVLLLTLITIPIVTYLFFRNTWADVFHNRRTGLDKYLLQLYLILAVGVSASYFCHLKLKEKNKALTTVAYLHIFLTALEITYALFDFYIHVPFKTIDISSVQSYYF